MIILIRSRKMTSEINTNKLMMQMIFNGIRDDSLNANDAFKKLNELDIKSFKTLNEIETSTGIILASLMIIKYGLLSVLEFYDKLSKERRKLLFANKPKTSAHPIEAAFQYDGFEGTMKLIDKVYDRNFQLLFEVEDTKYIPSNNIEYLIYYTDPATIKKFNKLLKDNNVRKNEFDYCEYYRLQKLAEYGLRPGVIPSNENNQNNQNNEGSELALESQ